MPPYDIVAPTSVFRALDDLSDADYEIVAATIFALADDPFPPHAIKLRVKNARLRLADGTPLDGPFLRVRARSVVGGKSGGFRIIYIVDTGSWRVCLAKIARWDDETYKELEQLVQRGRIVFLSRSTGNS